MHNFEARYRAIVEKEPGLRHHLIELDGDKFYVDGGAPIWPEIALAAVCLWLAGKLAEPHCIEICGDIAKYFDFSKEGYDCEVFCGDPADAILTAWEIILGIKEGA